MPPLHAPVTDFASSSMNPLAHGGLQSSTHSFRKTVVRKTVDFNSSVINHIKNRLFSQSPSALYCSPEYEYHQLPPSVDYVPLMTIPFSHLLLANPSHVFATKYISQSQNKTRSSISSVTYCPDDARRVLTASDRGEFTLWNGLTFNFETLLQAHEFSIRTLVWSNSNLYCASGDDNGVVKIWQSSLLNVRAWQAHQTTIRDITFSPNDGKIATASDDQTVSIWDFETIREERQLIGHGSEVRCASWHPSMSLLLTGGKDQLLKLWDPRAGGKELMNLHSHKNTINRCDFNKLNDGRWFATGGRDQLLKIWDIRQLSSELEIESYKGHKREISAIAWHTQCERLVTTGSYDGDIKHWYVGSGSDTAVAEIDGAHDQMVTSISWHPLGHMLVSGSTDCTIRYWARNRPGDEMSDKYNVSHLPDEAKQRAMMELVEAAQLNPTRSGAVKIPHQIAEALKESGMDIDRPNMNDQQQQQYSSSSASSMNRRSDLSAAAQAAAQRMKHESSRQRQQRQGSQSPNRNSSVNNDDDQRQESDYRQHQQQQSSNQQNQSEYTGPSPHDLRPRAFASAPQHPHPPIPPSQHHAHFNHQQQHQMQMQMPPPPFAAAHMNLQHQAPPPPPFQPSLPPPPPPQSHFNSMSMPMHQQQMHQQKVPSSLPLPPPHQQHQQWNHSRPPPPPFR